MKPLAIEDTYLWVQRFIAREWHLIAPVALAFLALPMLAFDLLAPPSAALFSDPAAVARNPDAAMHVLAWLAPAKIFIFIISAYGGLAITALALAPGVSVGEALAVAARRLWVLIGSLLLLAVAEALVVSAVIIALGVARLPLLTIQSVALAIVVGLGLFVSVRLVPVVPMIVRRRIGPVSALRESWMMTAGVFWRIFGAVIVYLVGAIVVVAALTSAVGAILLLLGKAIGDPALGAALNIVFSNLLAAMVGTGVYLLAAAIFRQLDGSSRGI